MSQAMFLLPVVLVIGLVAVFFFERPGHFGAAPAADPVPPAAH